MPYFLGSLSHVVFWAPVVGVPEASWSCQVPDPRKAKSNTCLFCWKSTNHNYTHVPTQVQHLHTIYIYIYIYVCVYIYMLIYTHEYVCEYVYICKRLNVVMCHTTKAPGLYKCVRRPKLSGASLFALPRLLYETCAQRHTEAWTRGATEHIDIRIQSGAPTNNYTSHLDVYLRYRML